MARAPAAAAAAVAAPVGQLFPRNVARLITVILALGVVGFSASLLAIFVLKVNAGTDQYYDLLVTYLNAASLDVGSLVPSVVTGVAAAFPLIIAASCYNDIDGSTKRLSFLGKVAAILFLLAAALALIFIVACQVNNSMDQLLGTAQLAKLTANVTGVMSFCTIYFLQLMNWRPA
jgi:hypothetical protein